MPGQRTNLRKSLIILSLSPSLSLSSLSLSLSLSLSSLSLFLFLWICVRACGTWVAEYVLWERSFAIQSRSVGAFVTWSAYQCTGDIRGKSHGVSPATSGQPLSQFPTVLGLTCLRGERGDGQRPRAVASIVGGSGDQRYAGRAGWSLRFQSVGVNCYAVRLMQKQP